MKIIDEKLLNWVSALAKESTRLGRNYDFYRCLEEEWHGWGLYSADASWLGLS